MSETESKQDLMDACPGCDSANIRSRVQTHDYYCQACGHTFNQPKKRPRGNRNSIGPNDFMERLHSSPSSDDDDDEADGDGGEDAEAASEEEPETEPDADVELGVEVESKPAPEQISRSTCGCCGSPVGNTSRSGLCYGCDLAGCDPEKTSCGHRGG